MSISHIFKFNLIRTVQGQRIEQNRIRKLLCAISRSAHCTSLFAVVQIKAKNHHPHPAGKYRYAQCLCLAGLVEDLRWRLDWERDCIGATLTSDWVVIPSSFLL